MAEKSMTEKLIDLLATFKYPVIRQGSLAPEQAYPDTFFTFWNNDESGHSFYDNETANVEYSFDVNVYSTSPNTAYTLLDTARDLLKANGWIIVERAYDARSDEITHVGRGCVVEFLNTQT